MKVDRQVLIELERRRGKSWVNLVMNVQARIEKLEADNERLRQALRSIAEEESTLGWRYASHIAKTALENNDERESYSTQTQPPTVDFRVG